MTINLTFKSETVKVTQNCVLNDNFREHERNYDI
jgi:hypothetical protein